MSVRSAIRWTIFGTASRSAIQLIQFAILSRLLDPGDFGLMAIATPYVVCLSILSDQGLSSSIFHVRNATAESRSSLFWFGLLWSSLMAAAMVAAAPLVEHTYGTPGLTQLMAICAISLPLQAATRQIEAAAERELRFRGVNLGEFGSALIGSSLAIGMALAFPGPLPLAVAVTSTAAARAAIAWAFLSRSWRPTLRLKPGEVMPFVRYGFPLTVSAGAGHAATSLDLLVGGLLLDPGTLGLYSVPRQLVLFLVQGLSAVTGRVTIPVIASIRENSQATRNAEATARGMVGFSSIPLMGLIALNPDTVCRVGLGPEWAAASGALSILALWGWARLLGIVDQSVLAALGQVRKLAAWNLASTAMLGTALMASMPNGPESLAKVNAAVVIVLTPLAWYFLVSGRTVESVRIYLVANLRPVAMFAMSAGLAGFIAPDLPDSSNGLRIALTIIGYLVMSLVFDRAMVIRVIAVIKPTNHTAHL